MVIFLALNIGLRLWLPTEGAIRAHWLLPALEVGAAFSPTDVMPPTHRAKYLTLVQSTIALALFGLIVARAVNAFT